MISQKGMNNLNIDFFHHRFLFLRQSLNIIRVKRQVMVLIFKIQFESMNLLF